MTEHVSIATLPQASTLLLPKRKHYSSSGIGCYSASGISEIPQRSSQINTSTDTGQCLLNPYKRDILPCGRPNEAAHTGDHDLSTV